MSKLVILGSLNKKHKLDENEKAEIKLFGKLSKALKDTTGILYFKPKIFYHEQEVNPDILWIFVPTISILVIEVKAWSYDFLKYASVDPGGRYINTWGRKYENPLWEVDRHKNYILSKLRSENIENATVDYAVAFPNLTREEFERLGIAIKHYIREERCIFKDDLKDYETLKKRVARLLLYRYGNPDNLLSLEDSIDKIDKIRKVLFPELTINKGFLKTTSGDIPILDVAQEKLLRNVSRGLRILRGAPGSGKTVTIVGKAIYEKLYKTIYGDTKNVLIITFTRILTEEIREMIRSNIEFNRLNLSITDFDIHTMHSLIRMLCNKYGVSWNRGEEIDVAIRRLLSIEFDEEDKYDVILCDEVQDFGKNWFKLIDCLKKEDGIVIFCVDETQRIYDRSMWKWKDVGIEARGRRVIILRKSYRTPTKFLKAAIEFLKKDKGLIRELRELEGINLDEIESVKDTESIIRLLVGDEVKIICKIIKSLLEYGYTYSDIYVLSPFKWHLRRLYQELSSYFGESNLHLVDSDSPIDDKKPPKDKTLFTTYVSSKGLENRVVIVSGTDLLPRSTTNYNLTPKQIERVDRRRLYVAMTRAKDLLFLTASEIKGFAKELCELREYIATETF